jgi:sugar/nucleoside kinase (ribokinase family)
VDWVEALRLSGTGNITAAVKFFIDNGVHSFIITHGPEPFHIWSDGTFFKPQKLTSLPVSSLVGERLANSPELKGDTTGCGDNFAGGVLASVAQQLCTAKTGTLDIIEACSWGCASGGFACFYVGGTYLEQNPGEKTAKVAEFQQAFMQQIAKEKKLITVNRIP